MITDSGCIFCKIVAGQIPSFKVYEDEVCFAFLDIGPIVDGHTLVVPKDHHATLAGTPAETMAAVSARLPKIAQAVLAATGAPAFHLLVNNGPEAMQSVGHLHFHILPRRSGDSYHLSWPTKKLDMGAGKALADAIKAKL